MEWKNVILGSLIALSLIVPTWSHAASGTKGPHAPVSAPR
jgi:hypothetical protein